MKKRTKAVEADPASCEQMAGCAAVDTRVALLPFVAVQANGKEMLAQPGSTVREALLEAGETELEAIAKSLKVARDYAGRSTPIEAEADRRELLELSLVGGEVISWDRHLLSH